MQVRLYIASTHKSNPSSLAPSNHSMLEERGNNDLILLPSVPDINAELGIYLSQSAVHGDRDVDCIPEGSLCSDASSYDFLYE